MITILTITTAWFILSAYLLALENEPGGHCFRRMLAGCLMAMLAPLSLLDTPIHWLKIAGVHSQVKTILLYFFARHRLRMSAAQMEKLERIRHTQFLSGSLPDRMGRLSLRLIAKANNYTLHP